MTRTAFLSAVAALLPDCRVEWLSHFTLSVSGLTLYHCTVPDELLTDDGARCVADAARACFERVKVARGATR